MPGARGRSRKAHDRLPTQTTRVGGDPHPKQATVCSRTPAYKFVTRAFGAIAKEKPANSLVVTWSAWPPGATFPPGVERGAALLRVKYVSDTSPRYPKSG
jgi:hypothetical protein